MGSTTASCSVTKQLPAASGDRHGTKTLRRREAVPPCAAEKNDDEKIEAATGSCGCHEQQPLDASFLECGLMVDLAQESSEFGDRD